MFSSVEMSHYLHIKLTLSVWLTLFFVFCILSHYILNIDYLNIFLLANPLSLLTICFHFNSLLSFLYCSLTTVSSSAFLSLTFYIFSTGFLTSSFQLFLYFLLWSFSFVSHCHLSTSTNCNQNIYFYTSLCPYTLNFFLLIRKEFIIIPNFPPTFASYLDSLNISLLLLWLWIKLTFYLRRHCWYILYSP